MIRGRHAWNERGEGMLEMGDKLAFLRYDGEDKHTWSGRKECLGRGEEEEGMFEE